MLQVLLSSPTPMVSSSIIMLPHFCLVVYHVTSTMDVGRDALVECSCILVHRTAQKWSISDSCQIAVMFLSVGYRIPVKLLSCSCRFAVVFLSSCCQVPVKLLSCSYQIAVKLLSKLLLKCCKALGKLEPTSSYSALTQSSTAPSIFLPINYLQSD